jgi:hypothetical protein
MTVSGCNLASCLRYLGIKSDQQPWKDLTTDACAYKELPLALSPGQSPLKNPLLRLISPAWVLQSFYHIAITTPCRSLSLPVP